MRPYFLSLALLAACASSNPWKLDLISTGNEVYDSARLVYRDPDTPSPTLLFEILRVSQEPEVFLSLTHQKFTPLKSDPSCIKVFFTIDGIQTEELIPLLEGRMRLRFPAPLANRLINSLQDGKQVGILVDGFEETLDPREFQTTYDKFAKSPSFFRNLLRGPLQ
jgi:hypothetical protein